MTAVTRLVTYVDLDKAATDAQHTSVTARLEAVLADDRSLVLLNDRGWSWTASAPTDAWSHISAEEIEEEARTVVGPDEPTGGETHEQVAAGHWSFLAGILTQQGVDVEAQELAGLSHDVVLSEHLRARIRGQ
ncbi:hypothetical protein AB0D99_15355 [Streptomyces sp. NPDC047971]|uniref:hypothetical protein n=1 Tax=Streptomyces sp. NPDC047971 TaxID=3154499 RepID=UPI0033EB53B6